MFLQLRLQMCVQTVLRETLQRSIKPLIFPHGIPQLRAKNSCKYFVCVCACARVCWGVGGVFIFQKPSLFKYLILSGQMEFLCLEPFCKVLVIIYVNSFLSSMFCLGPLLCLFPSNFLVITTFSRFPPFNDVSKECGLYASDMSNQFTFELFLFKLSSLIFSFVQGISSFIYSTTYLCC